MSEHELVINSPTRSCCGKSKGECECQAFLAPIINYAEIQNARDGQPNQPAAGTHRFMSQEEFVKSVLGSVEQEHDDELHRRQMKAGGRWRPEDLATNDAESPLVCPTPDYVAMSKENRS